MEGLGMVGKVLLWCGGAVALGGILLLLAAFVLSPFFGLLLDRFIIPAAEGNAWPLVGLMASGSVVGGIGLVMILVSSRRQTD